MPIDEIVVESSDRDGQKKPADTFNMTPTDLAHFLTHNPRKQTSSAVDAPEHRPYMKKWGGTLSK